MKSTGRTSIGRKTNPLGLENIGILNIKDAGYSITDYTVQEIDSLWLLDLDALLTPCHMRSQVLGNPQWKH